MREFQIRNINIQSPIYLPDATRAVVKGLSIDDVEKTGIEAVVVNTYHLHTNPGPIVLEKNHGVKNFMKFNGLVTSDSGGWQVFSLLNRNKNIGSGLNKSITDEGVYFEKGKLFTPETSIQMQFSLDSDIVICLDDFTPPDASLTKIKETVDRTILWAKKCKVEYDKLCQIKLDTDATYKKPLLLAVIQGGWDKNMREYCARKLIEIGFDAYGFGGYVIDEKTKKLDLDMAQYVADLIPNNNIKFALGTGTPHDIAMCTKFGWDIFDCTLPTRDARHKRLYNFANVPTTLKNLEDPLLYKYIYIGKTIYETDETPIDSTCDCYACKTYSKAYLHHLFKIKDMLAFRLATIHNLRNYVRLTKYLRLLK